MNKYEITEMLTGMVEEFNEQGSVHASFSLELDCVRLLILKRDYTPLFSMSFPKTMREDDMLDVQKIAANVIIDHEERTKGASNE